MNILIIGAPRVSAGIYFAGKARARSAALFDREAGVPAQ